MPELPLPTEAWLGQQLRDIERRLSELEGARAGNYGVFGIKVITPATFGTINTDGLHDITGATITETIGSSGRALVMFGVEMNVDVELFVYLYVDGVSSGYKIAGVNPVPDMGAYMGVDEFKARVIEGLSEGEHTFDLRAVRGGIGHGVELWSDPALMVIPL